MEQNSPHNYLRMIATPHILSTEKGRLDVMRPAGGNVNDLIRSIGWIPDSLSARVFIDGEYVRDAAWEYTVPRAGQSVIVRAIPMGGGGGGQGKDAMMIVAMVGIIALSLAMPAMIGSLGVMGAIIATTPRVAAALTAGTSIMISLALSGLIPQPLPRRALPQPARASELKEAA